MTPSQKYYYENLDKFAEYASIRNNAVRCNCCNKSYRHEYMPLHIETTLHKKNEKKLNAV